MVSTRETKILIADEGGLFPANWIYPDDDLFPVGVEVREITKIISGTLKLDEMIAERIPQFGQLYSSKFECGIYMETDLSGKHIAVYQKGDDNVMHGVFFGKIDSCKTDRVGTDRTIVAYDNAYTLNSTNIANWWTQFWSNRETATLKQVRDSLTNNLGITSENVELPNDSLEVTKTVDFSSCTFQQMLKMICELNCCFPHINREGILEYIILDTEETPIDLDGLYEWTNSNFEEYETAEITGVQFFDSDEQLKYTVGESDNAYPVMKNIFLYNVSTTVLQSVGNTMLSYLEDLVYNPASIKMIISDMEMHLGTYVTAEDHNFYIFQNSLSGQQFIEQTVSANGEKQLYTGTPHLEYGELILNQKIARVAYDLDQFEIEYGQFVQDVNGTLSDYNTRITTNARGISAEVTDRQVAIATSFANYTGSNNDTAAKVATATGSGSWNTDALKKQHAGEVYYDTTTKHYWEYTVTLNNSTGAVTNAVWTDKGTNIPTYGLVTSTAASKLNLTSTEFNIEISTETSERKAADLEGTYNYTGNYVPTNANTPASSWNTDALKKQHVGEVYYRKISDTSGEYYVYTKSGSTYSWVLNNTNTAFDVITKSRSSRINMTDEEISSEVTRATNAEKAIFANYTGAYVPTTSNSPASNWTTTTLKKQHVGETFYNTSTQKYYKWTATTSGSTTTYSWEIVDTAQSNYNVVSSAIKQTADQIELKVSSDNLVSTLNSQLQIGANYINIESDGKIVIDGENFKLDEDGYLTATGATLNGGNAEGSNLNISDSSISYDYNGDSVATITGNEFTYTDRWGTTWNRMGLALESNEDLLIKSHNGIVIENDYSYGISIDQNGIQLSSNYPSYLSMGEDSAAFGVWDIYGGFRQEIIFNPSYTELASSNQMRIEAYHGGLSLRADDTENLTLSADYGAYVLLNGYNPLYDFDIGTSNDPNSGYWDLYNDGYTKIIHIWCDTSDWYIGFKFYKCSYEV